MDFEGAIKREKRGKKPSGIIERSSAKKLIPDKNNPNRGSERGAEMIDESLKRLKTGRSIVVDRNNRIIAGNQTVASFQRLGQDDVDIIESDGSRLIVVKRTDLDLEDDPEGKARELSLADNRTSEISYEVDPAILASLTENEAVDLSWMYSGDELAAILAANAASTELLTDEDEVPEPPKKPVSKRGQVWILGRHRLMCGDSTSAEDVAKLMDGAKADMVFTDPPYGISVQMNNPGTTCKGKIMGDDTTAVAVAVFKHCMSLKIPSIFWGANHYAKDASLPNAKCWICWDKQESNNHIDQADCEFPWTNIDSPARVFHHLWSGFRRDSEKGETRVHPTQKPIELIVEILELFKVKAKVVDFFGGSGSTLIACEKTNRICYMMELDPQYSDVIRLRWELATGQKAVLYGNKKASRGKIPDNRDRSKVEKASDRKATRRSKADAIPIRPKR
jgi:hypothetical protein